MKSRLLDINPQAEVEALEEVYSSDTRDRFHLADYDYIIDAIDSLSCKADLILTATALPAHVRFFSSMGAAMKTDASQIRSDEFWNVKGCPLARALRQHFKRSKTFPRRKFRVVFSPELQPNLGPLPADAAPYNGTLAHTTAIFGFTLAGLVIQDIIAQAFENC
jgi:tRNA A37 threonylcarbamoyladenosine dehydratase